MTEVLFLNMKYKPTWLIILSSKENSLSKLLAKGHPMKRPSTTISSRKVSKTLWQLRCWKSWYTPTSISATNSFGAKTTSMSSTIAWKVKLFSPLSNPTSTSTTVHSTSHRTFNNKANHRNVGLHQHRKNCLFGTLPEQHHRPRKFLHLSKKFREVWRVWP